MSYKQFKRKLLLVLDSIEDPSLLSGKSVKHALFGSLSLEQLIEQVHLHEQRHIEQIKEIKARFESES